MREELDKVRRIADMMTSSHCALRDKYARRALVFDLAILTASVWLVAMAFVDPQIAKNFSIPGTSPTTTIGLIAIITFVLSLFQLRTDWKYQAERYDQAAKAYGSAKVEIRALLSDSTSDLREMERALRSYRAIGERVIAIPENQFNRLKKKHLQKIRISEMVDKHPSTSLAILKARLWISDTWALLRS